MLRGSITLHRSNSFALGVAGGRVIIFGSSGTVAFDPISNVWTEQSSTFGLQGVQAQLNVISSGTDGALWFGSDRGLVRIDPEIATTSIHTFHWS